MSPAIVLAWMVVIVGGAFLSLAAVVGLATDEKDAADIFCGAVIGAAVTLALMTLGAG